LDEAVLQQLLVMSLICKKAAELKNGISLLNAEGYPFLRSPRQKLSTLLLSN
jgi:hypothetical protein